MLPTLLNPQGALRALVLFTLLAAASLAALLHWPMAPRAWVDLLRYLPYPAWLLPTLLVWLVAWAAGWRWGLLASLAPAIVLTGVMGWTWGAPEAGRQPLRFMTYNIKAYRAHDRPYGFILLADELRRWDADVVVMQDATLEKGPLHRLPEELREALPQYQIHRHDQYVVASRLPLAGCRSGLLTPGEHQRGFLRCTLRAPGGDIDVLTVHFLSPRDGLNATRRERLEGYDEWRENWSIRLAQSAQLAEEIARQSRPLILAGDLNAEEASPVVQQLLARGLRDAWSVAGRGWGHTYGHALKLRLDFLRIDHILVSPEFAVRAVQVGAKGPSEHRPVIADLFLQRDAGAP